MKTYLLNAFNKVKEMSNSMQVYVRAAYSNEYIKFISLINIIKRELPILVSHYWQYYYRVKNWFGFVFIKYKKIVISFMFITLFICSWWFFSNLNSFIEPYFSDESAIDGLQTLFVSLGGALIGATAIAFSLIMFAMQVNVERMPHGLFRKFSSDSRLLASFGVTFTLAIAITILSLIPDKDWVTFSVLVAGWCVVLIVLFLLIAYRRALSLISPTQQLTILLSDTKRNLEIWAKAAKRTTPLLEKQSHEDVEVNDQYSNHIMGRVAYFKLHPGWTIVAKRSVAHCISFSRRYAEQGDHEVSEAALNVVIAINAAYINAKGKTFFINNPFFNNPLSSDGFITDTLEHLRQNIQIGISRGDEQQIEQGLRALERLCVLYSTIDYSTVDTTKTHANLAAAYLMGAVETVAPHDMTDVLMEGIRLMGSVAQTTIGQGNLNDIAVISEKIALISCVGVVNQRHRPIIQVGIEQLSKLTFSLLTQENNDIQIMIEEVRADVKLVAEMLLKVPDTKFSSIHSSNLASYYSGTSNDTLMAWLTQLTNAVSEADADNEDAKNIIDHIEQWSDNLYQTEKELLLLAIKEKSGFTFDIIHWIVHITKLLLAVSCADACNEHNRKELRNAAHWLIYVLSWIPDDEETIKFVEAYRIADQIFEAAIDAKKRDCEETVIEIYNLLLSWTFKAGKHQTGWASLEQACCGLACLNIILDLPDENLFSDIDEYLSKKDAPSIEIRSRTASDLHDEADKYRTGYGHGAIDVAMAGIDQTRLRELLHGVADHLLPETNSSDVVEVEQSEPDDH